MIDGAQRLPAKPLTDLVQRDVGLIQEMDGPVQSEVMGIMAWENSANDIPGGGRREWKNPFASSGLLDSCHDITNKRKIPAQNVGASFYAVLLCFDPDDQGVRSQASDVRSRISAFRLPV